MIFGELLYRKLVLQSAIIGENTLMTLWNKNDGDRHAAPHCVRSINIVFDRIEFQGIFVAFARVDGHPVRKISQLDSAVTLELFGQQVVEPFSKSVSAIWVSPKSARNCLICK